MAARPGFHILIALACLPSGVFAQTPVADTPPPAEDRPQPQAGRPATTVDLDHLPPPLEDIAVNVRQFERTGHLQVVNVAYRTLDARGRKGIVWRLRVERPLTSRLAKRIVDKFRRVGFRVPGRGVTRETHMALLFYSRRLDFGAVAGDRLRAEDEFDVWIYLDEVTINKIQAAGVSTAVLSPIRRR